MDLCGGSTLLGAILVEGPICKVVEFQLLTLWDGGNLNYNSKSSVFDELVMRLKNHLSYKQDF